MMLIHRYFGDEHANIGSAQCVVVVAQFFFYQLTEFGDDSATIFRFAPSFQPFEYSCQCAKSGHRMNLLQMTAMFAHVASRSIGEAGNRNRPNAQCLIDLTNVFNLAGFVHFGFVINAYARLTWVGRLAPGHGRLRSGRPYLAVNTRSAWLKPIAYLRSAAFVTAMAASWPRRSTVSTWRKLTTIQPSRLYDKVAMLKHNRL